VVIRNGPYHLRLLNVSFVFFLSFK
ncbi:hypothetical protein AZ023_002590, partial [Klebsiella pneumoniae]